MRVLVIESDRQGADGVTAQLEAAGHTVVRCHEPDLPVFPCNALFDQGECPLDQPRSVDVVVDHRSHAYPSPTEAEDGVSCALRHHVPLVASGVTVQSPYERWVTAYVDDGGDVVAACEAAASAELEQLSRPATEAVREVLGVPADGDIGRVDVRRSAGRLRAVATLPHDADEVDGEVAVKISGVLRHHDRNASQIDVAVRREQP